MAKRWNLVVKAAETGPTVYRGVVEGPHWMAALKAGLAAMGDTAGVPAGVSCTVSPSGQVVVDDPRTRRVCILTPAEEPPMPRPDSMHRFARPTDGDAPVAPAPLPAASPADRATLPDPVPVVGMPKSEAPRGPRKRTVALDPGQGLPGESAARPLPVMPRRTTTKSINRPRPLPERPHVRAVDAPADVTQPLPDITASEPPASVPPPSAPPAAEDVRASLSPRPSMLAPAVETVLLAERDEDPSATSPLHYRERLYFVPPGTSADEAESAARILLANLRSEVEHLPAGRFLNIGVFDHEFHGAPLRPPLVVVQWKDWRDRVDVEFPLEQSAAPTSSVPPDGTPSASMPPAQSDDERLAYAFEACQELFYLSTPRDSVDYALRLIDELIPSDASAGALYDIDADAFRVVVASGTGADRWHARAVPASTGLFGAATIARGKPIIVDDLGGDGRFDARAEGREGLEARSGLYMQVSHHEHLLGAMQLLRGKDRPLFTTTDANLLAYVARQLGKQLHVMPRPT
ncbi:MAG: GAF domain-containing protein [Myxococcales bacterium]|nr:GAF domain-containing protein [Myxococcales bacterium]